MTMATWWHRTLTAKGAGWWHRTLTVELGIIRTAHVNSMPSRQRGHTRMQTSALQNQTQPTKAQTAGPQTAEHRRISTESVKHDY